MLSVGVLYSCQTFLKIVRDGTLNLDNFESSFRRIEVADGRAVLSLSQTCQWIRVTEQGRIGLTERGQTLVSYRAEAVCLREQILDVLSSSPPPWARRLTLGRFEALKVMPDDAQQCFRECELTDGFDDDTVTWWDQASETVRSERSKVNHQVGRNAERLSLKYEKDRTGKDPLWQAVQTNVAGYDVLSVVDATNADRLKIEVKGSRMGRREAAFFLTRNEWRTATKSNAYQFHLWLIHEMPVLFVVPSTELAAHVPEDRMEGLWETARFSFKDFTDYQVATS
ncbi:DUF3883 domain-containing protein [Fontisubflavum oceani]|uniref:DUF3883 domain-containing protein n=1 Tax=Fontisubflavum oceani TaxID=2978973 RepID=UPI0025B58EC4|nr:DUF3883 domain-containing protein [Fontisubflavum oceani]WJY21577.1 DUF3883 domain-containing protein [Fontisubflavum oceani]